MRRVDRLGNEDDDAAGRCGWLTGLGDGGEGQKRLMDSAKKLGRRCRCMPLIARDQTIHYFRLTTYFITRLTTEPLSDFGGIRGFTSCNRGQ